jgi:hypothetical protein
MRIMLEQGDKVKIIPTPQLMELLQKRNFCSDDETRKRVSDEIGGKEGIVKTIEQKWAFDYFYFLPNGSDKHYSIPYESVDFMEFTK